MTDVVEAFIVCEHYCPPDGFTASLTKPLAMGAVETAGWTAPFVAFGDLSVYDSPKTKLPNTGSMTSS